MVGEQLDIFGARPADVTHNYRCTACGRRGHNATSGKCPDIDAQWAEFHHANPHVMNALLRLARARLDRGERRIGVKALWEELRSELAVSRPEGAFKLNNNYTAVYARKLIELEPRLATVIETRTRKAKK